MVNYVMFYEADDYNPFFCIKVKDGRLFKNNYEPIGDVRIEVLTEEEFKDYEYVR